MILEIRVSTNKIRTPDTKGLRLEIPAIPYLSCGRNVQNFSLFLIQFDPNWKGFFESVYILTRFFTEISIITENLDKWKLSSTYLGKHIFYN